MNLTPNLKLKKPLSIEKYDVNVFNSNCDTVDSAVSNMIAGIENNTKETEKSIKELKDNKADAALVGAANGIAPLDSGRKVPPNNIPFGTISGTCFEGNMGKKLRDEFNAHINEFNSHTEQSAASFKELENNLAAETERAVQAENTLREDLSSEAVKARNAEKENADSIAAETRRAQAAEEQLEGGLNLHMQSASAEFKTLHDTDNALETKKANKTDVEAALAERYTKDQTYSRQEVLDKIEALIGAAPDTLDTFKEIADALGNDPNFATTIMTALAGKVDKEDGKALSSNNYSDDEKSKVQASYDIRHTHGNKTVLDKISQTFLDNWTDAYNKRHEHSNKGVLDGITTALITAWNSAVTHVSDVVKHITAAERTNWNDADSKKHTHGNKSILDTITQALITKWNSVDNKVDKVTGKGLSANDYTTAEKQKLAGIAAGAEVNVQSDWNVTDTASDAYIKNKPSSMPASDVPEWAKASEKPVYTWQEVTGKPSAYTPVSHTHTKSQITDMPTKLSQFTNDTEFITAADVDTSQNHTHANKTILDAITQTSVSNWNSVTNKVDKVSGKGLSTNDFTATLLSKLNGIADGAQVNTITGIKGNAESSYRTGNVNLTSDNIGAAPKSHAVSTTTYGAGTNINYGHVKLSDAANFTSGVNGGIAATPTAVKAVYDLANGKAASSHTHTKANITDFPTSLKNPSSITIQGNGTSLGSYDGSSAKTINITPSNIGAAASSHTHSTYENQNAFSNVTVGSTTLAADSMTDTLTLVAGDNITLTADAANDKVTISSAGGGSTGDFASKSIYGDSFVSLGRASESTVGKNSFAFGGNVTASGENSFAVGSGCTATSSYSHAEGIRCTADDVGAHAEGGYTTASYPRSHAEGDTTEASGWGSHAEGCYTIASNYGSHASGKYNVSTGRGAGETYNSGTAFAIGNGTSDTARSNAFSVTYTGVVKAKSTITGSTTADYAELFEWADGNPENKDNAGYFVTLDGDKLKYASEGDYILGVISGEPFVLGNSDCDTWNGMYLRDNFNRTIYERVPMTAKNEETGEDEEVKDADGNTLFYGTRPVLNPDYDPSELYVSRMDRPEWDPVGMLGVLSVHDDGTCEVNGYCKCNNDAIATKSDTGYRVIKRVTDNIIRIIFR